VHRIRPGHVPAPDPRSCQGLPCPRTSLWSGPYSEGSGPHPRDPVMLSWESRAVIGGPGCAYVRCSFMEVRSKWYILGCIIFSCHVVPLKPPTWWGAVLFIVRLGNVVRAPRLHTVVGGTPDSGYRQALIAKNGVFRALFTFSPMVQLNKSEDYTKMESGAE
jgi:hypothetical protein